MSRPVVESIVTEFDVPARMRDGVALIPLSLYWKDGNVKMGLGLCKGKKLHDKRDAEAEKSAKRDIDRTLKERNADG